MGNEEEDTVGTDSGDSEEGRVDAGDEGTDDNREDAK